MPAAADSAIFRPVTRPPVKETRSISGWEDSGAPTPGSGGQPLRGNQPETAGSVFW